MTRALLALGAAALAGAATRWVAAGAIPSARLLRKNYRGVPLPSGLGVAVLAGSSAGVGLIAFVHAISPRAPSPAFGLAGAYPLLLLGFGFGLLGLFDDLSDQPDRGWRAHLPALAHGRVTPGTLKLLGGATLAFVVAAARSPSFAWAVGDAALIALSANLFNSLDVRPGRAAKIYLVAAVPLTVLAGVFQPPLAATLGAAVAFLAFDLRERAMLGDAGSNALGAMLGGAIVLVDPQNWVRFAVLGLLAVLTLIAEGPTLSAVIDRVGPLRSFDRAGRAPV